MKLRDLIALPLTLVGIGLLILANKAGGDWTKKQLAPWGKE